MRKTYRLIVLCFFSAFMISCDNGSSSGDNASSVKETTTTIFEETFEQEGLWDLSTQTDTRPDSDDSARAIIQNGRLEVAAVQGCGCVHAIATLTDDLIVNSDVIKIEIDFSDLQFGALGEGNLELTNNKIKVVVLFGLYGLPLAPTAEGGISTLMIEHRNGYTTVHFNGEAISEDYYTIEKVNSDGLEIAWRADACGADCYATAVFKVDYIGIFEINLVSSN